METCVDQDSRCPVGAGAFGGSSSVSSSESTQGQDPPSTQFPQPPGAGFAGGTLVGGGTGVSFTGCLGGAIGKTVVGGGDVAETTEGVGGTDEG